jgi:hypothetical protein
MKRHKYRIALHRKKRVRLSRFPYVRYATVLPAGGDACYEPCLRLQGEWLNEAGFFTHWRVKITVRGGRLVIEPLIDVLGLFRESHLMRTAMHKNS